MGCKATPMALTGKQKSPDSREPGLSDGAGGKAGLLHASMPAASPEPGAALRPFRRQASSHRYSASPSVGTILWELACRRWAAQQPQWPSLANEKAPTLANRGFLMVQGVRLAYCMPACLQHRLNQGPLCGPFAGKPAPTGTAQVPVLAQSCRSGLVSRWAAKQPQWPSQENKKAPVLANRGFSWCRG